MLYFKFPFEEDIFTITKSAANNEVDFHSFDLLNTINFKGDVSEITPRELLEKPIFNQYLDTQLVELEEETQSDYEQKLVDVIDFINENNLSKLVISRRKLLLYEAEVSLSETFLNLCKSYPNAFVYFFIKNGKCWLGAFSELLGKFNKKTAEFETMSLAGTLPISENWTTKEINEQKPVTDFIKNILQKYSLNVENSETYDHISGNIKHLRTDFKAKIKHENIDELISELHPTPAVCGIPKDICIKAIERFEDHPRNFYAGYIKVENDESVHYYVNLRCAEFFENAALIYVGGGITSASIPAKEWRETELKSEAILKNISCKK